MRFTHRSVLIRLCLYPLSPRHVQQIQYRQIGPGMVQKMQATCPECHGEGKTIAPRDRCRDCAGKKVVKERKVRSGLYHVGGSAPMRCVVMPIGWPSAKGTLRPVRMSARTIDAITASLNLRVSIGLPVFMAARAGEVHVTPFTRRMLQRSHSLARQLTVIDSIRCHMHLCCNVTWLQVLEVHVTPGMKNGEKITFHEEADESPGMLPGDVVFVIQSKPHDVFQRKVQRTTYFEVCATTKCCIVR
jgi:DnaJ C terminal domain/DnaJ central domain